MFEAQKTPSDSSDRPTATPPRKPSLFARGLLLAALALRAKSTEEATLDTQRAKIARLTTDPEAAPVPAPVLVPNEVPSAQPIEAPTPSAPTPTEEGQTSEAHNAQIGAEAVEVLFNPDQPAADSFNDISRRIQTEVAQRYVGQPFEAVAAIRQAVEAAYDAAHIKGEELRAQGHADYADAIEMFMYDWNRARAIENAEGDESSRVISLQGVGDADEQTAGEEPGG